MKTQVGKNTVGKVALTLARGTSIIKMSLLLFQRSCGNVF